MKVIIFILITPEEGSLGSMRFPNKLVLNPEESAGVSRSWLRGVHAPCKCGVLGVGKNTTGGLMDGLAVESVDM